MSCWTPHFNSKAPAVANICSWRHLLYHSDYADAGLICRRLPRDQQMPWAQFPARRWWRCTVCDGTSAPMAAVGMPGVAVPPMADPAARSLQGGWRTAARPGWCASSARGIDDSVVGLAHDISADDFGVTRQTAGVHRNQIRTSLCEAALVVAWTLDFVACKSQLALVSGRAAASGTVFNVAAS